MNKRILAVMAIGLFLLMSASACLSVGAEKVNSEKKLGSTATITLNFMERRSRFSLPDFFTWVPSTHVDIIQVQRIGTKDSFNVDVYGKTSVKIEFDKPGIYKLSYTTNWAYIKLFPDIVYALGGTAHPDAKTVRLQFSKFY